MVKKYDFFFLLYFLPLFFLKLLTFDASSNLFKIIAVTCFGAFALQVLLGKKYNKEEIKTWLFLGGFLSILVFTCGKEGALFSAIAIISMRKTHIERNRSILFWVGILGVLLCFYLTSDTREAIRYVNGEWVSMTKRSNIAYISFFAVANLYLMAYKKYSFKVIGVICLLSYCAYKYTGCRTGMICSAVLLLLLFLYRYKWFQKSKVVKFFACATPIVCYMGSVIMVLLYNSGNTVAILANYMLQGRLKWGSAFMSTYTPKLLGQKLAEDFSLSNFMVLDCAYLDMYLCYGILFSILWIVSTTYVIRWLYRKNDFVGVSIIIAYSVFGMAETFLPNCFLNPSLLLYGECLLEKLNIQNPDSKPIRLFRIRKYTNNKIRV